MPAQNHRTIETLKGHIVFYPEGPFMLFNGTVSGLYAGSEDEEGKIKKHLDKPIRKF